MNPVLTALIGPMFDLIGKYFPSEEEKTKAKLALITAEQNGQLEETKQQLSAILAEAQSSDPWTSRARPSFLYVIYLLLVFGIPMGFLSAYNPTVAANVANGFKMWLTAIPSDLYYLFGIGYCGYTAGRSFDKWKGTSK